MFVPGRCQELGIEKVGGTYREYMSPVAGPFRRGLQKDDLKVLKYRA